MFTSTKDSYQENRKAELKNYNLPILQYMYMGSPMTPLQCSITQTAAFVAWPCIVQNKTLNYFRLDFNHIRQRATETRCAGTSVDKDRYGPSDIFRARRLDNPKYVKDLVEFMCMMPISTEYHAYVSQSSAYGDITLSNFEHKYWPWHLKSEANFAEFTQKYSLDFIPYNKFIEHLSTITHSPIRQRLDYNPDTKLWKFV